eukprot:TRINITY_DN12982_c0_g1_i1.p2 TRINITY_DN12982_c0_g1~~TRINITY_DN12982_c0_g1_i1.p2  ORF type:complete len:328 (-),score=71.33 TRINITY_DN12982_c0_g1_i1:76-1059(-)
MATHSAVQILEKGGEPTVVSSAIPTLGPKDVLIRTFFVGMNPLDAKNALHGLYVEKYPYELGKEGAGVVHAVGAEVTKFAPGSQVFGAVSGRNQPGVFAEHFILQEDFTFDKPSHLSWQQVAGFTLAARTAFAGLRELQIEPALEQQPDNGQWLLVWGGATTVGFYAIQLARRAGYRIIATASPKNHGLVRALGADVIVDYHLPDAADCIRAIAAARKTELTLALDCVSGRTAKLCVEALSSTLPATVAHMAEGPEVTRANVTAVKVFGPRHIVAATSYLKTVVNQAWLQLPATVVLPGLSSVGKALRQLDAGQVSASKLVVEVATP